MSHTYWYITGMVTTFCVISAVVNLLIITGAITIESRYKMKQRMHVIYNWEDDSGPINRSA